MKFLFLFFNLLTSYRVVWENTDLKIPLKANTHEYYDMPEAKVYQDGKVIDTNCYYEKGVNHTSLSVVNSNHVRVFKVDYRVYFPELAISNTQTINFIIVDETAPVFLKIPDIKMPVNAKKITEKEIIETLMFEDNYYSNDELIIRVNNLHNVNINVPGNYLIEYEIMDPSFNVTLEERYYIIENNKAPIIKYDDLIKHEYGKVFNYLEYFKFLDEHDPNLIIKVCDDEVNYNKIGIYQISVSATNSAGLMTRITTNIEIIDKSPPNLVLKDSRVINVYEYDSKYLRTLIYAVSDNYDNLTHEDVVISGYISFDEIGKYNLEYSLTDSSDNKTSKKIVVEVKDLKKPEIKIIKELNILVNEEVNNWYEYFMFSDNYDESNDLVIKFNEKSINYQKIGSYFFEVVVTDSSKNSLKNIFTVLVIDIYAPEVSQNEEIVIDDFSYKELNFYKSFFDISDNYNSFDEVTVELNGVIDYKTTGTYNIEMLFKDTSNNVISILTSIYVLDLITPNIKLTTNEFYYYIEDPIPNLISFISEINDNYTSFSNLVLTIYEDINYTEIGLYEVIFEVMDEGSNKSSIILSFYVDIKHENLIFGNNVTINKNEKFEMGTNIEFHENVSKVITYPNTLDTSNKGVYEILYIAYDYRGNYREFIQKVEVIETFSLLKYKNNIILTIIGVISIGCFVYYHKKNNELF